MLLLIHSVSYSVYYLVLVVQMAKLDSLVVGLSDVPFDFSEVAQFSDYHQLQQLHASLGTIYRFIIHLSKSLMSYQNIKMMISKFNGTSTPKRSYSAKTGVDCPVSLNRVHYKRLW